MPVDVLLGLQWGDEGKGKIVDVLGHQYAIIARFQGGPNAGHTLVVEGKKYVLHQIPSGIFHPGCVCLIGNGVVLNPVILQQEIETLLAAGVDIRSRLLLSRRMHLILPTHRLLDKAYEQAKGEKKIGSTLRGIGPTYQDKMARRGVRLGEIESPDFAQRCTEVANYHLELLKLHNILPGEYETDLAEWNELFWASIERLRTLTLVDSEYVLAEALAEGKQVLAEGAQGALLDIDFGSYPFVTSSNTTTGGACSGLGIPPNHFGRVFGVFKAYCTRVGSGPFPTELFGSEAEELRQIGGEYGATTGRPRRIGWLDLPALKYACMLNGVTDLVMTKADVLSGLEAVQVSVGYQTEGGTTDRLPFRQTDALKPVYQALPGWVLADTGTLPETLEAYIRFIESYLGLPVSYVSVGADRKYMVSRTGQPA
ncbi:MAG: adenylosuccinate synthase [Bacteroidia bacterium]|nr:adenylosuccinate synthase [Bacteroidia bacterium]